jgi:hypothetical protein
VRAQVRHSLELKRGGGLCHSFPVEVGFGDAAAPLFRGPSARVGEATPAGDLSANATQPAPTPAACLPEGDEL